MANKKEETASFVVRFTQKIFQSEEGEAQVQWRGNIRHVQGGDEQRFSEFNNAVEFIKTKLADLTQKAVEDKPLEEQKGILSKSFDLWRKMAKDTPKMVVDTIKDPMKQISNVQSQVQDQISQVKDNITQTFEEKIGKNLEIDEWRGTTKSDYKNMMGLMEKMAEEISRLNDKVDELSKKI